MRASIRGFVEKQLNIRQKILSLGDKGESRYSSIPIQLANSDGTVSNINLQKGSFFTQAVSRQAVIRMYSGVDIKKDTFEDYPNEPTGVKLAKRFFLEGGAGGINKSLTSIGGTNSEKAGFARHAGSFSPKENFYLGAYGATNFRAHPHKGYGVVPMPGITDASIRTVSDYGSLRVAKVHFVCYNLPQLEVLELLYMRPGYPILLEWGWAPYISNTGNIEHTIPYFEDFWKSDSNLWKMHKEIITKKATYSSNYDAVLGFCKNFEYKGRPDGGFDCTTEIMGYGEVMEGIQGRDETPMPEFSVGSSDWEVTQNLANKNYGSPPIPEWVLGIENSSSLSDNFVWLLSSLAYYTPLSSGISSDPEAYDEDDPLGALGGFVEKMAESEEYKDAVKFDNPAGSANSFQKGLHKVVEHLIEIGPREDNKPTRTYKECISDIINNYVVSAGFKGISDEETDDFELLEQHLKDANKEKRTKEQQYDYEQIIESERLSKPRHAWTKDIEDQIYIRWDFMCEIINKFVLPQHKEDTNKDSALTQFSYTEPDGKTYLSYVGPPYLGVPIKNSIYEEAKKLNGESEGIHFPEQDTSVQKEFKEASQNIEFLVQSSDPNICIMPGQRPYEHGLRTGGGKSSNVGKAYDPSYVKVEKNDATGSYHTPISDSAQYKAMKGPRGFYVEGEDDGSGNLVDIEGLSKRYIGLIYINYKFLMDKYKEHKEKKDFSLFSYIEEIWKDISNKACAGNHEFIMHTEENQANIRVIDLNIDPTKKPPVNVFEFKVQDKESIVREFDFSSTVPNSFSATIAIAAQSPDVFNKDSTSLSALTYNIESRFTHNKSVNYEKERKILVSYQKMIKKFVTQSKILNNYFNQGASWSTILDKSIRPTKWGINLGRMDMSSKELSNIRMLIKNYTSLIHRFNSIQPTYVNEGENPTIDENGWYIDPKYKQYYPETSFSIQDAQNTALIPIAITMVLDGISGIRIGDVVKIHNVTGFERLPKGYTRDDIYWVVFGDDHSITAGQDWRQKLSLQLSIMGDQSFQTTMTSMIEASDRTPQAATINKEKDNLYDAIGNLGGIGEPPSNPSFMNSAFSLGFLNPAAVEGIGTTYRWSSQQNFGPREMNDKFHNGVDIVIGKDKNGNRNDGVYMPVDAEIIDFPGGVCGNGIKFKVKLGGRLQKFNENILGTTQAESDVMYIMFCHLKSFNKKKDGKVLKIGDKPLQGERIGTIGKTGCGNCGVHLHYGLSLDKDFTETPYTTNRNRKNVDGDILENEFVVSTYEEEFGIDPGFLVSSKDNITAFREGLIDSENKFERTLKELAQAHTNRVFDSEGKMKWIYDLSIAFLNCAEPGSGICKWTNGMKIIPSFGIDNQHTFFKKLNEDPIALKIYSCAANGYIDATTCTPESVGLSTEEYQKLQGQRDLSHYGIMK